MNRRSLLLVATIVAALALGTWINSLMPSRTDILDRPFLRQGSVGQPVRIRTGTVMVLGVDGSRQLTDPSTKEYAKTTGVFVVATVQYEAAGGDSFSVTPFRLHAPDGRLFGGGQPLRLLNACGASQPGIPVICDIPLEVAPDALPGSRLEVFNYSSGGSDDRAMIDLGITDEQVRRWTAAAPLPLRNARYPGEATR